MRVERDASGASEKLSVSFPVRNSKYSLVSYSNLTSKFWVLWTFTMSVTNFLEMRSYLNLGNWFYRLAYINIYFDTATTINFLTL